MTTIRVGQQVQLLYARGWGPGCLANTDLINPVFFGLERALDGSSDQIPALGAIPVDGSRDIFGSTLAGGTVVAVQSMPGVTNWAPSPAQVSAQINALGLMKDTTGQAIGTNTGNVHTDLALGTNAFLGGTSAGALVGTAGNTVAKEVGLTGLNASVPQKIATGGTYGVNTSWAEPAAISYPLGAAYEILFTPQAAGSTFWTDVQVDHFDGSGSLVYRELFSISNWSNTGLTGGTSASPGCLIRGNLHGQSIKLSGLTAANANYTTVFGAGTNTGIKITYYSQSYPIPETRPKVSALVSTGFLAFVPGGTNLAAGATFNYGVLPSYTGKGFAEWRAEVGGGFGVAPRIQVFSVLAGTSPLYETWFPQATSSFLPNWQEHALDQLLHRLEFTNVSSTIAGTYSASFTVEDFI